MKAYSEVELLVYFFGLSLHLQACAYFVYASSEGSGESVP